MDCLILINGDSGTLKTADLSAFEAHVSSEFENSGHTIEMVRIDRVGMNSALDLVRTSKTELLIAAGGDGTVSAMAELAWESGRFLGVLPGGTMNLYARTLNMPDDLFEAVSALAQGRADTADIATANGAPFINQYAVGFHPRAVRLRNKMDYSSRIGKIWATLRAMFSVMTNPPSMLVELTRDDRGADTVRIAALSVSNNMIGTGHDLFADHYDGHVLGVYRTPRVKPIEAVRLILDLIIGRWAENDKVLIEEVRKLTLRFPKKRGSAQALRDGELVELPDTVQFEIHDDDLKVWVPQPETLKDA
ncbi:diacylglycerol kinase family protein [Pararhizobium sp. IMCC21322]|uniref:diacylglycerol/lipid kinase family protein n=1 Tax=Pararhizobium sp. IMCC21322 TaxID=3067903 RepID=UPI0027404E26|nr:diacylglycerol kinase family protein [Pararhizobium sp. IMCC21322]